MRLDPGYASAYANGGVLRACSSGRGWISDSTHEAVAEDLRLVHGQSSWIGEMPLSLSSVAGHWPTSLRDLVQPADTPNAR